MTARSGVLLGIDTSTRQSVVVAGRGAVSSISRRAVGHRHGAHVLEQVEEALSAAGASLPDVEAIAVGTGPGSFTGLRVGLATAKTLAYVRGLPLIGVSSTDALRLAAVTAGASANAAVILPAGAHDHYLALPGREAMLVAPGGLEAALGGDEAVAVDIDAGFLGAPAAERGAAALAGLPAALLELAGRRLALGEADDAATLTPAYVALPRGVSATAEDAGWSPDLR